MTPDDVDTDPPGTSEQRRRYPAPTIDLKATEIPPQPGVESTTVPPSAHADKPETTSTEHRHPIEEAVASARAASRDSAPAADKASVTETAGVSGGHDQRHPIEEAVASARASGGQNGSRDAFSASSSASSFDPLSTSGRWLATGAAGGAIVMLVAVVLWSAGLFGGGDRQLAERMARVEQQVGTLSERAAPSVDPTLANRLAATEAAVKSLAADAASLTRRVDDVADAARGARERSDVAARALAQIAQNSNGGQQTSGVAQADLDQLARRVDSLESATRSLQSELTKTLAKASEVAGDDRALRFAVIATALRLAVERGQSFTNELAQAKRFIADPKQLAPLEPFAEQGVPSPQALGRELAALTPGLLKAADVPNADAGFLSRLQANAEHLVRIRPIDETPGDEPATVLLRIELRSAHGDLAGALAEFAKLPEAVRAPADAWIKKAQARESAIELVRRISADALSALSASAG